MTKFYTSQRRHRSRRGVLIAAVIGVLLLLLGVGGYVVWQKNHDKQAQKAKVAANDEDATKYISFGGSYLFSIPATFAVDETLVAGMTIIYSESSPPQAGKSLDQLYANGALTIESMRALKDNDAKAFKDYVNKVLAADLGKTMKSATDVREAKHGGIEAFKVLAQSNDGKRLLRIIYALNFSQPVVIVAKEENNTMKIVGGSIEDLQKSKSKADIDQVTQATKTAVEMIQNRDILGVKSQASTEFKKSMSDSTLTADLEASSKYLARSITIVGGSYNGKDFVAQLVFEPTTKNETPISGVVSMHKQGKNWELQAFELPR